MNNSLVSKSKGNRGVGLGLLGLGLFFLLATIFGGVMSLTWPFFVLAPGLFLFYMVRHFGKKAAGLVIPASIISMVGLLLFYQNLTNHWESWAYAWSLVVPTALGIGISVYGDLNRDEKTIERGENIAKVGLGMFFAGLVFFELLLNLGGLAIPLAILFVIAGIYMTRRKKKMKGVSFSSFRDKAVDQLYDEPPFVETPIFETEQERVRPR